MVDVQTVAEYQAERAFSLKTHALEQKLARADARIAELEQAVTVRDTEIARLEADLELARREVNRLREALDQSALEYADLSVSAKSLEEHLSALVEVSEQSTIALARAALNGGESEDEDEDAARAGNGGEV